MPKQKDNVTEQTEVSMNRLTIICSRVFGFISILISLSFYTQCLPLLFILMGGLMSIPSNTHVTMDAMVWLLTCATLSLLSVVGVMLWIRFLYRYFIKYPKAFSFSRFKKNTF